MMIRGLLVAIAAFVLATPAQGQTQTSSESTQSAHEDTASALRDVYQALFFDTGMFDTMTEHFLPQYRQTITSSTMYQRGGADRRADLDALIARTPEIMRDEVITESGIMANNIAPEMAALATAEELRDYASLIRLPLWQRHIAAMAEQAARTNGSPHDYQPVFTDAEQAEMEALEHRPGAQAMARQNGAMSAMISREMNAASARMRPRLQQRLAGELCSVLGRECPPALRNMTNAR